MATPINPHVSTPGAAIDFRGVHENEGPEIAGLKIDGPNDNISQDIRRNQVDRHRSVTFKIEQHLTVARVMLVTFGNVLTRVCLSSYADQMLGLILIKCGYPLSE